jgi:hypothetical protein
VSQTNGELAGGQAGRVGGQDAEDEYQEWLEMVAEADLDEGSKDLLKNLVSKDWVLANFEPAEVNEFKFRLEIRKLLYSALHPAEDCLVTGEWRAYINDDPDDQLTPLSQQEQMIVDGLFQGLFARITRGREGFQQEMLRTQIREQRQAIADETQRGGLKDRVLGGNN